MGDNIKNAKEDNEDEPIVVKQELLCLTDAHEENASESMPETKPNRHTKSFMVFKTIMLICVWICMGMRLLIEFAAIPNLRRRLQTDVAGFSYALSFGAIGGIVAIPLAMFSDRFTYHSDVILSGFMAMAAVFNALKPYCTDLIAFAFCNFMQEIAISVMPSVGDSMVLLMWGSKAGGPVHAVHAGFTVGSLIGPLIVSAVIFDTSLTQQNTTNNYNLTSTSTLNVSDFTKSPNFTSYVSDFTSSNFTLSDFHSIKYEKDNSKIEIAFIITSVLLIVMALVFLILEFIKIPVNYNIPQKKSVKWKSIINPSKWADGNFRLGVLTFVLMNLYYFCLLGSLKGPLLLITTYAVDSHLGFSGAEAAALSSAGSIGGAVSRAVMALAAGYFSVNKVLIFIVHGQLIATLLLLFFGPRAKLALWIFSCLHGVVTRPIWPTGYQWANEYIILFAFVFALHRMVCKIVDAGLSTMQGYLYSNVSKESIFYTSAVYALLACFVLYAMLYLGKKYPTRHERQARAER